MRIDTIHEATRSVVKIQMLSEEERRLTDEDWKRVAFNQHRLLWRSGDGTAVLPRRLVGTLPDDAASVERYGDHISVILPCST